ncbi:MAG: hypothetical protein HWD60_11875 [Defluviicoccus sp.]|nr:MAG: hypothetical protein HWD60_11875 [Defluviicoccus sp.]
MAPLFRYRLSDDEKDALLCEQAALIERQAARIAELEALLARPKKTSRNSHTPPSQDWKLGGGEKESTRRKPRPCVLAWHGHSPTRRMRRSKGGPAHARTVR